MAGRKSAFHIEIDIDPLTKLVDRLGTLTPEEVGRFTVNAINEATDSAYELGRHAILSGINLTDDYVQRKMTVQHATEAKPKGVITARGGKDDTTSLSHYGAMQTSVRDKWTNADIIAAGHTFSRWYGGRGWTKRTGNTAVGIEVDKKAAGRSVEVVKGRRKDMRGAFAIPGKKDNDGNLLVFRRTEGGGAEALTGPSVYQLFRVAARDIKGQVSDILRDSVIDSAERQFQEVFR